jgi:hypothetical protein
MEELLGTEVERVLAAGSGLEGVLYMMHCVLSASVEKLTTPPFSASGSGGPAGP